MLEPMLATRVIADPDVLDGLAIGDNVAMRLAPDDLLVIGEVDVAVSDPHAIVRVDSGWKGGWLPRELALAVLEGTCEWPLPTQRPAFAQGKVAQLAVKLYFTNTDVLFLVPAPLAADLIERIPEL